jgi:hypothetical protein
VTSSCPITSTLWASGLREFPCYHTSNSPEIHILELANLLPYVLLDRVTKIHFGSSLELHGSAPRVLLNLMATIYSSLQTLKISNFKTYLAPLAFTRIHGSSDVWLSTDQWLRSSRMIERSIFTLALLVSGLQESQIPIESLSNRFLQNY